MGESPATYAHADAVAELTERVRREHSQALAWTLDSAPALQQAIGQVHRPDALMAVVAAFQHLTSTDLTHLPDREAVANDVITAALFLASGVDYASTSVQVRRLAADRYRVRLSWGDTATDIPVPAPPAR